MKLKTQFNVISSDKKEWKKGIYTEGLCTYSMRNGVNKHSVRWIVNK